MMRGGTGAILLSVCCGLVGCVAPPKTQPVPEGQTVPAQWAASVASTASTEAEVTWWESFASAELTALLEEAFQGNPDLLALTARVEGAAANARIAGADLYPTLSGGFDGARRRQNFIGFPIPGSDSDVLTTRFTTYGLSLNTSWELDLWGRVRAGKRAALADAEAAAADLAMQRLSLAAQLSKAWVDAIAAQRQWELAAASAGSYAETADKIKDRYERGLRSGLDVRLSVNSVESANALVQERRRQWLNARQQLEILLGRYPAGNVDVPSVLPSITGSIPAGIPAEVLQRRPDLRAAERRLAAADQRVWQSRAALFPQLSLTGSTGTSTAAVKDLLDTDLSVWSIAGNVAQPLLQGGRLRAGIDLSRAQSREAAYQYLSAIQQAFREVEFSLASEAILATRERHLVAAAAESEAALALANRRYESGLEELINVLESQRRSLADATQVIDVHRTRLVNRIDLYLALGGGSGSAATEDAP